MAPIEWAQLFHRHTRASYVCNGCLAWYNVVLTPRTHSSVKYVQCVSQGQLQVRRRTAGDSCDGGISVLYNCLSWYKFVNTHLYHSRQLYNMLITRIRAIARARSRKVSYAGVYLFLRLGLWLDLTIPTCRTNLVGAYCELFGNATYLA